MLTDVGEDEGNRVEEPQNSAVTEILDHHAQSNGGIQFIWTLNLHLVSGGITMMRKTGGIFFYINSYLLRFSTT